MGLIVDVDHPGTSESVWESSDGLQGLPGLALPPSGKVLVVAPHPDDEVLGAGGLIQRLLAVSASIEILAVTDGEACYPGVSSAGAGDLAAVRSQEVVDALLLLGWEHPVVTRLGIPDGQVPEHEGVVRDAIGARVGAGDLIVAPWVHDGHTDHEAVGRASHAVSSETEACLISYLVWAWHWVDPAAGDLPWDRLARIDLTLDESARKRRAVHSFQSQILPHGGETGDWPVLPPAVLKRFLRDYEVYVDDAGWS